jgi:hypothetical protein
MKQLAIMLAQTSEALGGVRYPRVSVAWQDLDLVYRRVYNPNPSLGTNIVGKRLDDIMTDKAELRRLTKIKQQVLKTGKPYYESLTIELGGKTHHYDLTIERTTDEQGRPDGLVSVNIDVSDLVKAKQQLAEANERLVQILADTLEAASPDVSPRAH